MPTLSAGKTYGQPHSRPASGYFRASASGRGASPQKQDSAEGLVLRGGAHFLGDRQAREKGADIFQVRLFGHAGLFSVIKKLPIPVKVSLFRAFRVMP
jgi:hypothetical protein